MKRWLFTAAALTSLVAVIANGTTRGQVPGAKPDVGPGAGGATLKLPGYDSAPAAPAVPDPLKNLWSPTVAMPGARTGATTGKIALPASNPNDMNKDIEITPAAGQWMIFAMAYTGPKAPEMARKFVAVMRSHYKMNAYVFNYGAKEKQAEYERVEKIRREQMEALAKQGLKADMPIRVTTMRIDEQTGVLVGGYKTREEAIAAVAKLKLLDPKALLDNRVDLDIKSVEELDGNKRKEAVYVNPFTKAFPTRNPCMDGGQASETSDEDLQYMRKINDGEPFNLLKCRKTYTLAVKQFNVQYRTLNGGDEGKRDVKGFFDQWDSVKKVLSRKGVDWEDGAANNAHKLAKGLRDSGLADTFVLHLRYTSFVTVGAFDRADDPRLVAMQNYLEGVFKGPEFARLDMMPRPAIMRVPGVGTK